MRGCKCFVSTVSALLKGVQADKSLALGIGIGCYLRGLDVGWIRVWRLQS